MKIRSLKDACFNDDIYLAYNCKGKYCAEKRKGYILEKAKLTIHINDCGDYVLSDLKTGLRLFDFTTYEEVKEKLAKVKTKLIEFRKTDKYKGMVKDFEEQKRKQGL